jgi:hypothetical protein
MRNKIGTFKLRKGSKLLDPCESYYIKDIKIVHTSSVVGSGFFSSSIGLPTTTCIGCLNGTGDLKKEMI